MKLSAVLAALSAVALFWVLPATANAQYLEPKLSVFCSTNQTIIVEQNGSDITAKVVDLQDGNKPVEGVVVVFQTTGGTLAPPSGTTNAQGEVKTTLDPGDFEGDIQVTAHVGSSSCNVEFQQEVLSEVAVAALPFTGSGSAGNAVHFWLYAAAAIAAGAGLVLAVGVRATTRK